jgi:uncharacterized RDD family membrane protein YckC
VATCPSCGREQDKPSAFCTSCGAVLDRPAADAPAGQPAPGPTAQTATLPPEARQIFPGPPPPKPPDHGDIGAYIVRRFVALFVDVVFVGTLIAMAARTWLTRATDGDLTIGGFVQVCLVLAVALFLYRWLFSGIFGSTPGKLFMGLVVSRNGGGRAGLGRTFVRELLLPIDLIVIGFLLAAVLPRRQRLGDLIAGTVVVNSRIGSLAPLLGIMLLGGAAYATVTYGGGVGAAQRLAGDASRFGPGLMKRSSPSPAPAETPSPPRTIPLLTPSPIATSAPAPSPTPSTTV